MKKAPLREPLGEVWEESAEVAEGLARQRVEAVHVEDGDARFERVAPELVVSIGGFFLGGVGLEDFHRRVGLGQDGQRGLGTQDEEVDIAREFIDDLAAPLADDVLDSAGFTRGWDAVAVGVKVAEDDELVDLIGVIDGIGDDVADDGSVAPELGSRDDAAGGVGLIDLDDFDAGVGSGVVAGGVWADVRRLAVDRERHAELDFVLCAEVDVDVVLGGVEPDDFAIDECVLGCRAE